MYTTESMSPTHRVTPRGALAALILGVAIGALVPSGEALGQAGAGIIPPNPVEPINYLPNPYETVRDWGELPDGRTWGSVSALHVDIDGEHIWVADRCGANSCVGSDLDPIVKFDADGNAVTSFGAGLIAWPHGMHVDAEGNVWIADARGPNANELEQFPDADNVGHQVLKFSPEGELLLVIGTPGEGGAPPTHLFEPNDLITNDAGEIFVLEGHNGQFLEEDGPTAIGRVSKFAPDGTFLMSFGGWGTEPGQFRGPHAVAMDSDGRLFISDRGNRRLQIFDQDGNLEDVWFQFSRISGMVITDDDTLYAIDSESDDNYNPGWRKGIRVGSAETGEVWYFVPEHVSERASGMGGFGSMGEGITVDADGNMYSGEVGPVQGVTKYIPRLID